MNITNCMKCNKVIQLSHAPLCVDCRTATYGHVQHVCQFVLEHPGLILEEVARQCQLSLKDMEEMLFSGRLGSAAAYILFKCQSCHIKMSAEHRKGRFCPECANKIETQVAQLEREAAAQKEKPKPLHRGASRKEVLAEVIGSAEVAHPEGNHKSVVPVPIPVAPAPESKSVAGCPEVPAKQESVSPVSDSYGFKRASDL